MPESPIELLESGITTLGTVVRLEESDGGATHTAIVASGLDDRRVTTALGRYLVGVIGGAVQHDARLSAALLPEGIDGREEVQRAVVAAVGETNTFITLAELRFRDRVRNPWIAEGLAHALLVVRSRIATACVAGPVRAVSKPHSIPSTPGLDAVAIYELDDQPFVAIGECKATRRRAVEELRKAAGMFSKIDQAVYGPELRSELGTLRDVLSDPLKDKVTNALWQDSACYVPAIVHGEGFDYLADRSWLSTLNPPTERRRVLVLEISAFYAFFDAVADAMRAAVNEVIV